MNCNSKVNFIYMSCRFKSAHLYSFGLIIACEYLLDCGSVDCRWRHQRFWGRISFHANGQRSSFVVKHWRRPLTPQRAFYALNLLSNGSNSTFLIGEERRCVFPLLTGDGWWSVTPSAFESTSSFSSGQPFFFQLGIKITDLCVQ